MSETVASTEVLTATAQIAASYCGRNEVQPNELPGLIVRIHDALTSSLNGTRVSGYSAEFGDFSDDQQPGDRRSGVQQPAVPPEESVFPDYIVCLEDGRKMTTLKRHLRVSFNLTPEQYRAKWGLPATYPLVAPNYAELRSALAKQIGLGRVSHTAKARKRKS